jgi:hypothetical protein
MKEIKSDAWGISRRKATREGEQHQVLLNIERWKYMKPDTTPGFSIDEEKRLRAAFQSANAIVDLAGLPFNDEMAVRQERIIRGEMTFDEAIAQIISMLKAKQG